GMDKAVLFISKLSHLYFFRNEKRLPFHIRIRSLHILQFGQNISHIFTVNAFFSSVLKIRAVRNCQRSFLEQFLNFIVIRRFESQKVNTHPLRNRLFFYLSHLKEFIGIFPQVVYGLLNTTITLFGAIAESFYPVTRKSFVITHFFNTFFGNSRKSFVGAMF